MVRRYGLREDQWEKIEHLLPGREDTVGGTAKDNRLFIEAVLYRYRAGIPWRDLPERGSGIFVSSTHAIRAGANAAFGSGCSSVSPMILITNTP